MIEQVKHLAQMRLEYTAALKQFEEDGRLTDTFITPFKLRLDMAIVDAILATYRVSDEFQTVMRMLTPHEVGLLVYWGAQHKDGRSSVESNRTQGAA